jgi:16S rRNA (uracil1498-N3)-methyltransferase
VSAPHFFVEGDGHVEPGSRIALTPQDSAHALRSLRLKPGEDVTLSDDEGLMAAGRMAGEEDGRAVVTVDAVRRVVRRAPIVSVALAPPKGERLAWAVQKLGELGVDEVVPLLSARTVRAWDQDRWDRAVRRLEAIAREAAMQSRQPFVMRVLEPEPLEEVVAVGATVLMLHQEAEVPLRQSLPEEPRAIRLLVGPEGGFAQEEVDRARELGATPVSLGSSILRTETAAVVGAALVLHRYGRLG